MSTLDETLYALVNCGKYKTDTHKHVYDLLKGGANPNYVPADGQYSTVESAAKLCDSHTIWAFINHLPTDFNPRQGHEDRCPLLNLLKRRAPPLVQEYEVLLSETFVDSAGCHIYYCMKPITDPDSLLLFHALYYSSFAVAIPMIRNRHGINVNGYYHLCCCSSIFSDAKIPALLREYGYRQNGRMCIGDMRSHFSKTVSLAIQLTALEFAADLVRFDVVSEIVSFAEITHYALYNIARSGQIDSLLTLMDRCELRRLTDFLYVENKTPFRYHSHLSEVVDACVTGRPAIPIVMDMKRAKLIGDYGSFIGRHPQTPYVYDDEMAARLAIAVLKQNNDVHPCMFSNRYLSDALKPWSGIRHLKYYSVVFNRVVRAFIVSTVYCPNLGVIIPLELVFVIINCIDRTIFF